MIRTTGAPRDLIPSVVAAISGLDPDVPITQVSTMDEVLHASTAHARLAAMLLSQLYKVHLRDPVVLVVAGVLAAARGRGRQHHPGAPRRHGRSGDVPERMRVSAPARQAPQ